MVASGLPGLAVLGLLANGVTPDLVEQVLQIILQQAPKDEQSELLSIFTVFAEAHIPAEQLEERLRKEQTMDFMQSKVLSKFVKEIAEEQTKETKAELAAQFKEAEAELAAQFKEAEATLAAQWERDLQQTLINVLIRRFPNAPLVLSQDIQRIHDPASLRTLIEDVVDVPDLESCTRLLKQTALGNGAN